MKQKPKTGQNFYPYKVNDAQFVYEHREVKMLFT